MLFLRVVCARVDVCCVQVHHLFLCVCLCVDVYFRGCESLKFCCCVEANRTDVHAVQTPLESQPEDSSSVVALDDRTTEVVDLSLYSLHTHGARTLHARCIRVLHTLKTCSDTSSYRGSPYIDTRTHARTTVHTHDVMACDGM